MSTAVVNFEGCGTFVETFLIRRRNRPGATFRTHFIYLYKTALLIKLQATEFIDSPSKQLYFKEAAIESYN